MPSSEQLSSRPGRPRQLDGETERALLMNAALTLITQGDYLEVAVADILAEANLSTRSFYRHFDSKEALLIALMRRDADLVGRSLEHAVAHAGDPVTALTTWLDQYLAVFYESKRARRTTLYMSLGPRTSPAVSAAHKELQQVVVRPLVKVLRAGHRAGVMHSPNAHEDAMTIVALVSTAVGILGRRRTRRAAREHVMRFAWPALALPHPGTGNPDRAHT
ncbi:AcrR family transcriptional regulator [Mycobacterium sp. OTB74]|nr:AcrR family transcriptional regulator [Mycobacterium sp. OTB74]